MKKMVMLVTAIGTSLTVLSGQIASMTQATCESVSEEKENGSSYTTADVDGDGEVTTTDASIVLRDIAAKVLGSTSSLSAEQLAAADMDGGGVATSDVSIVLYYLSEKVLNPGANIDDYVGMTLPTPPPSTTGKALLSR